MSPRQQQSGSETPLTRGTPAAPLTADAGSDSPTAARDQVDRGPDRHLVRELAELFVAEPELIRAFLESPPRSPSADGETILAAALEAIAASPDYADLHCFTAAAALRVGRLSEAEALVQRALELNPHYVQALILSGQVARAAEKPDRAITRLQRAIAAGGDYADVHLMLADLWRAGGETELACRAYQRTLELNPKLSAARAALATLTATDPGGGAP
jgi:tetratricopeptide (TPR) repeat protein